MSRRLEKRVVKTTLDPKRAYCYQPCNEGSEYWWTFLRKIPTRDSTIPRTTREEAIAGTPLNVDELMAMDAILDGLDALVETIPGLFVVEE